MTTSENHRDWLAWNSAFCVPLSAYGISGRWLSPDPLGGDISNPQSLDRYAYALNSPTTLTDPSGLCGEPDSSYIDSNGVVQVTGSEPCWWQIFGAGFCTVTGGFGCGNNGPSANVNPSGGGGGGSTTTPPPKSTPAPSRVPLAPPNANLCNNIAQGTGVGASAGTAFSVGGAPSPLSGAFGKVAANAWLANAFQTGGQFDYKQQGSQYIDFGNFNFGAVCASVGDSLTTCQSGAGIALMARFSALKLASPFTNQNPQYGGKGIPFLAPPFGDQPGDSAMIAAGYRYAQQTCHP